MIYFDCIQLRNPNTGLYYFCDNLGKALLEECRNTGTEITFFVPKVASGNFGKDSKEIIYRSLNKHIFPYWKMKGGIWLASFQLPTVLPEHKPVLQVFHDLNFLYEEPEETHRKYLKKMQSLVDNSTRIVAISEYCRQDIMQHLDTKGKPVDVIYNGCNIYEGPVEKPQYVPKAPFLYSIGPTIAKKNFHVLPCLLVGNDFELVLSGIRYPYESKIWETAGKYGVSDRIHITGTVTEAHKHWYMKNCLAFVFPSIAEGFGLPVLEAMNYGKPVFLSRHTSLPEIGQDKAFYFNYDFDPDIMRQEFRDGLQRYSSGEVSPQTIMKHARSFSWEKSAREYLEVVRQMSGNC